MDMIGAQERPTDDAFEQHVIRAVQTPTFVLKSCARASARLPDDWKWLGGRKWVIGTHALYLASSTSPCQGLDTSILQRNCKSGQKCPCVMASLPCIELCMCFEHDYGNRSYDCNVQDSDDDTLAL